MRKNVQFCDMYHRRLASTQESEFALPPIEIEIEEDIEQDDFFEPSSENYVT